MYSYTITYKLDQGHRKGLSIRETIYIAGNKLSEDNNEIIGVINLREENDEKALQEAGRIVQTIMYTLTLLNNAGLRIKDLTIQSKTATDERGVYIAGYNKITDSSSVTIGIGKESEAKLSEYEKALTQLFDETKSKVYKIFHWYNRGLLDDDAVDRFIDFYVALEILGDMHYPSETSSGKVRRFLEKFTHELKAEPREIIDLRNALFHSGQGSEDANRHYSALNTIIRKSLHSLIGVT